MRVETGYPWQGAIGLTVEETPADRPGPVVACPAVVRRVPGALRGHGVRPGRRPLADGWLRLERTWAPATGSSSNSPSRRA
ncbi:hypothetical protein ACRAWF_41340 [Streptomyces sp. L7]